MVDEMKSPKADLAVMGYHHRRTFGEILLGTTAQQVARHAPCAGVSLIPPRNTSQK
jgi:nucleotide-binding universal stress UspA family protein